jgi:hypothetical protein
MNTDYSGERHRQKYGRSDKANAFDNQNSDWREGYDWGVETFAYDSNKILNAEIELRGEFKLTGNGFSEWKRGFWAARCQMATAGIKKRRIGGSPLE